MKKIWPWLFALLLLIIFCVWTKKDTMHVTTTSIPKIVAPVVPAKQHYVNYEIVQNKNNYVLHGNFTNVEQQKRLKNVAVTASSNLQIENTFSNPSLLGDEAISLTSTILPHFIKHYKNGKIVYSNETLHIYGDVDNYQAQHEMQRLLAASTIASQDKSSVRIEEKPLHFSITKNEDNITFDGVFSNNAQAEPIRRALPATAKVHLSNAKHLKENGAIAVTGTILSDFMRRYKQGRIEYKDDLLTISGMVTSKADLAKMNALLSNKGIRIVNKTTIDPEAVAQVKAQEEARRKALAENKRKNEEAKAKRLAQEAAAKKAKELAQAKADEEARLKAIEEAKRLAQEVAAKKAKALQDAKKNIIDLLKMQNIEFEVAKGSLTPRGKGTVDKLASILKQYPNIKIEIAGHTDSDGSETFNQKLSQSRVDTVQKRLITKGIDASRLTAKGYGESQPLVPNTSDANKQKNRRVEINIQGE